VNDAFRTIDQFMADFSCANAASISTESLEDMGGPLDQPPSSCTQLEMECPGSGFGTEIQ
jgi:hypothetical protein